MVQPMHVLCFLWSVQSSIAADGTPASDADAADSPAAAAAMAAAAAAGSSIESASASDLGLGLLLGEPLAWDWDIDGG